MKRLFYVVGLMYGFQTITNAATDCNQVTEIPVSECQALLEIYNNTNIGSYSEKYYGWNANNTPCLWRGISCKGGHVSNIDLSNYVGYYSPDAPLQGQFPDINLPELQALELSKNNFTSFPNFSHLPNLVQLNLSNNQLSGNVPDFSKLPKLSSLNASGNQLTGNIPDLNLPNLTSLNLSSNQLSGNIPNFSHLPSLQWLNLSNNKLTGCIPYNLPGNSDLSNNQLTGNIPNMRGMSYIYYYSSIHLSNNQLSGKIPAFFSKMDYIFLSGDGDIPIIFSEGSNFGELLSKNCGLIAYDEAQETLLNKIEPKWKTPNPHCSNPNTTCPLVDISLYNLAIHLPHVNYSGMTLSANLRYAPRDGKMLFEVADYSLTSNDCSSANLSPDFKLHIPTATLGNFKLWLNLQPYLATDGQIVFELISFGHV